MSSAHRRGGQSQKLQRVPALWKREGIPHVRFQACHLARQDEDVLCAHAGNEMFERDGHAAACSLISWWRLVRLFEVSSFSRIV